jgi:ribosomal protein S18 acetylase RimI-like enzyme
MGSYSKRRKMIMIFKTLFLTCLLFAGSLFCQELQGSQEMFRMRESWLSAISKPQEQSPEVFAWFSKIPQWRFNAITRFAYQDKLEQHLDSLLDKAPTNMPISFWLAPKDSSSNLIEALESRNFMFSSSYPTMSWDVKSTDAPELDIRSVTIEEFYEVYAACYGYSEEIKQASINVLQDKSGELFLGYLEGKPVGTVTFFVQGDTGVVFNLATLPEYQRRGVGRAMMHHIMNQASMRGLKKLVLNSSSAAEKLYYSLGFQKVDEVIVYIRQPLAE